MMNRYLWCTSALLAGTMLITAEQVAAQQQSASAQAMLEEVIVTARRREENLQDLPLSIAAISAEAMAAQGIYTIEDLSHFVPNVTLTTSDRANNTRVVIRGIGGGHPDPVFVFGSGMYIDGHYVPNSLGGYMTTMDIERVELLRGPQGTLFGKNVTGGAVNIITAKPGPEFDSSLTLRVAEDGQQDVRGMINFPISDNVFGRFGFASEQSDGYYYNRNLGIDTGGTDLQAFNAAFRFTPGDNWTVDFSMNRQDRSDDNRGGQCNPFDGSAPAWGSLGGTREDHLDRLYYQGYEDDHHAACRRDAVAGTYMNSSDHVTFSDLVVDSAFLTAQWDSTGAVGGLDALTFKVNGSWRYSDYDYLQDRDYSFYDIDNIGMPIWANSSSTDIGQDNTTRGWEFLVNAQASDRLKFTLGVNTFYELAKNGDGLCRRRFQESGFAEVSGAIGGVPQPAPGNSITDGVDCSDAISGLAFDLAPGTFLPFLNSSRIENESIGVFGHLTYAISDNWNLDLGARWTEDDREFWNLESAIDDCVTDDPSQRSLGSQPDAATGLCTFDWTVTFESAILDGFYNQASETFDEVSPMISLSRNLGSGSRLDSGMVYFLYSEGFLTGGFNTEINANLPGIESLLSYEPEEVKNYELGFKGTFADGALRIMADVFFMDYTNKQDSINVANPDGLFGVDETLAVVQNVSEVEITGLELELRASPWDGGFISLDVGWLDNEYGEYIYSDPACVPSVNIQCLIDNTNTTIQDLTAEWTVNLGIEHQIRLASGATITPRLNIYTQDDYDYNAASRDAPPSLCNQESYTKFDTRVTYRPPAANWSATLFGNNVTDEEILERCGTARGVYNYRHERPANWGLEFTANFGQI